MNAKRQLDSKIVSTLLRAASSMSNREEKGRKKRRGKWFLHHEPSFLYPEQRVQRWGTGGKRKGGAQLLTGEVPAGNFCFKTALLFTSLSTGIRLLKFEWRRDWGVRGGDRKRLFSMSCRSPKIIRQVAMQLHIWLSGMYSSHPHISKSLSFFISSKWSSVVDWKIQYLRKNFVEDGP